MRGKTHVICGTAVMAYMTMTNLQSMTILDQQYIPAIGLATVMAGSYMPDIDIQQSSMGQKYKFISRFLTHRGITHTLLIPTILLIAMYYTNQMCIPVLPSLILGFNVGWLTHIVADLFNRKGVPILWPLYGKKIHIATFKTGTWHEYMFMALCIGGLIACWIYL